MCGFRVLDRIIELHGSVGQVFKEVELRHLRYGTLDALWLCWGYTNFTIMQLKESIQLWGKTYAFNELGRSLWVYCLHIFMWSNWFSKLDVLALQVSMSWHNVHLSPYLDHSHFMLENTLNIAT